ncbi:MAG: TrmH family RNA methyltransferase [Candidatus Spechtbacterales bacterium]|nr:TrmH family RNA methyltransferase [Candidatus Spechtbacterales bacterium]
MTYNPDELHHIARAASNRQKGVAVLEDIQKENAYKILQLCDTFGIQKVYFVFEKVEEYDPAKIAPKDDFYNAGRYLDFEIHTSIGDLLDQLKGQEYKIVVPIFGKGGTDIYSSTLKEEKIAVIFGSEERGPSDRALGYADLKISIKRAGVTADLDNCIIAAIFLYELTRQRALYGMDEYLLPTEKEDEIRRRFSNQ